MGDRHATSDNGGRFSVSVLRGRRYRIQGQVLAPGGPMSDPIDVSDEMAQRALTLTLTPRR